MNMTSMTFEARGSVGSKTGSLPPDHDPAGSPVRPGGADAPRKMVCLAGDEEVRRFLSEFLSERGYEVSLVGNHRECVGAILYETPDIVLCDITMLETPGFEILNLLASSGPREKNTRLVFFSVLSHRENPLERAARSEDVHIAQAIRELATRVARRGPMTDRNGANLNQREVDCLAWSARGKSSDEIASILGLTKRTVDFEVERARDKLGAVSRINAVAMAIATGRIVL